MRLKSKAVEAVESVQDAHPVQQVKTLRRFVPNAVSQRVGRAALRTQHHSPEILFAAGLGLGVATVVTACRATLKLEGTLEDLQSDLADVREMEERGKLDNRESRKMQAYLRGRGLVRLTKLYAPSLALGTLAVASLTGSHHIMNRRNVALTAAYAAVEKSFDEYRGRVIAKYGEDEDRNIMFAGEDRTIVEEDENGKVTKKTVKSFGKGRSPYARVWDEVTSTNWKNNAHSNRTFIQCQQAWANDLLQSRGHLFLNEVHDLLGLERTAAGQIVGWVVGNGDSYVDFGIFDRQTSDQQVYDFMFGQEKSVLLDFNVDGPVWKLLDELNSNDKN